MQDCILEVSIGVEKGSFKAEFMQQLKYLSIYKE